MGKIIVILTFMIISYGLQEINAQTELGVCPQIESLEQRFHNSNAVFYGIPVAKESIGDGGVKIQIDILETYKGNITKGENTIYATKRISGGSLNAFGDPFEEMEKGYVVYAKNKNGKLWTTSDSCFESVSFRADSIEQMKFLPQNIIDDMGLPVNVIDEMESGLWWKENFWIVVLILSGIISAVIGIVIFVIYKKNM